MKTTTTIIPRSDYMDGKASHQEYYGQFVDSEVLEAVKDRFGIAKLAKALAGDKNLNNIPLASWDALEAHTHHCQQALRLAGDGWSMAGSVCILKNAARQLVASAS